MSILANSTVHVCPPSVSQWYQVLAGVWRPRRDLNPCYRRESPNCGFGAQWWELVGSGGKLRDERLSPPKERC